MLRLQPITTRTDTSFPYTTLVRSSPRRLEIAGYSGGRQPRPLTLRAMIAGAWVAAGALLCVLIACFGAGVAMLISGGGTNGGGGMSSAGGGGGGGGSSGVFSSSMILVSIGGGRMLIILCASPAASAQISSPWKELGRA